MEGKKLYTVKSDLITEETKKQLREIAPFWENNNLRARGEALIPEEMQVYMDTGFFGIEELLKYKDP